jgi:molybdenum cofactor guanylyltransferase
VDRAGYVLAGGRSSRMGRDKALLPFRGQTLADAVACAVEQAVGSVVLVGRGDFGCWRAIPDLYPGEGPLGGILTALADTAAEWNMIVACDMPELTAPFLLGLLEAAEASEADALVPAGPSGRLEPLCAVYHRRARTPLEAAFRGGVRKITAALESVRAVRFPVAEIRPLQNVNTPEDWSGYAAQ